MYLHLLPKGAEPTTDLNHFLTQLATRMGMLKKRGEVDLTRAAVYFVRWWREEGGLLAAKDSILAAKQRSQRQQQKQQQQETGPRASVTAVEGGIKAGSRTANGSSADGLAEDNGSLNDGTGVEKGNATADSTRFQDTDSAPAMPAPKVEGWGFDFQWDWQDNTELAKLREADPQAFMQAKMEKCIDEYLEMIDREEKEETNVSPTQIKKRLVAEEKARRKARYVR